MHMEFKIISLYIIYSLCQSSIKKLEGIDVKNFARDHIKLHYILDFTISLLILYEFYCSIKAAISIPYHLATFMSNLFLIEFLPIAFKH